MTNGRKKNLARKRTHKRSQKIKVTAERKKALRTGIWRAEREYVQELRGNRRLKKYMKVMS